MERLDSILYKAHSFERKNWLMSKVILENALKDFPNEKVLYTELGDLFSKRKMYKKAIEYYLLAYKMDTSDEDIIYKIASNFLSLDQFALSLEYFKKIKNKTPEIYYNTAYAYSRIGETTKSLEILQMLIKEYNTTEIPYLLLSEIYYSHKQYKKALDILDKAEKKFGESSAILYLKASIYSQKKLWLQAVTYYKKANKLKSDFPHFYRNYALALYHFGKIDEAIELLKMNLEKEDNDASTYFYLIKLLIEIKDYKQAKKYLKEAEKSNTLLDKFYLKAFEFQIDKLTQD